MFHKIAIFTTILTALALVSPIFAVTWDGGHHTFDSGLIDEVAMINAATADITGGYIGILWTYDACSAIIDGGYVGSLGPFDNSVIDIYSGNVDSVNANESSQINIYGGEIEYINTRADGGIITLHSIDYEWDPEGAPYGLGGLLTGYWLTSGDSFSIEVTPHDYQYLHFVPEPGAISFALIGTLILFRRRKSK